MTALIGVVGATGMLIAARKAIDSVARVPDVAANLSPAASSIENFLLVGSDSREGLTPEQQAALTTGVIIPKHRAARLGPMTPWRCEAARFVPGRRR